VQTCALKQKSSVRSARPADRDRRAKLPAPIKPESVKRGNEIEDLRAHPVFMHGLLQRKPTIGSSNDPLERDADRIAESVLTDAGPDRFSAGASEAGVPVSSAPPTLQRKCLPAGGWEFEYDGCSAPKFLGIKGIDWNNPAGGKKTQFALRIPSDKGGSACDRHDECYQTCNPLAKPLCDLQFLGDMVHVCRQNSENSAELTKCLGWAGTYYEAVAHFGGAAFVEQQLRVCSCKDAPSWTRPNE
jgi:hypothetical protein